MAVAKKTNIKRAKDQPNADSSLEREEYIRSLELTLDYLKAEVERLNSSRSHDSSGPDAKIAILEKSAELCNTKDSKELITALHSILSKYFSVLECNFYFKNDEDAFEPIETFDSSSFLDKQIDFLEEQGILDWVFDEKQIKIMPNLDDTNDKLNSLMIFPIYIYSDKVGFFLAASAMNVVSFDETMNSVLSKLVSIASILATNFYILKKLSKSESKFDIINKQLLNTTLFLSLGETAGTIAREMGNYIKMIEANNDLILKGIGSVERRAEIISSNLGKLGKLNGIINSLAYDDPNERTDLSTAELLRDTLEILEFQISNEDIRIIKEIPKENIRISGSKSLLRHVLLNLMLNARDAMPNGGSITIGVQLINNKKVAIYVADTGEGIPETEFNTIFEPHFSNKTGSKKLALSLYMTKHIIEEHKGKITLSSELGKGSTFRIILPVLK